MLSQDENNLPSYIFFAKIICYLERLLVQPLLDKLNLLPNLITKKHLAEAKRLFDLEPGDILCVASSKSIVFTSCALTTISDEDIISYAAVTDHIQFIKEIELRGLTQQVDLTQFALTELFPPKKLIKALNEYSA